MKARNLRGVEISSSRKEGLVGDLSRKGTAYDLWTLDPAAVGGSGDQNDGAISPLDVQPGVGAEELNGLSVLLPCRRKGGQLYLGACVCAARIHPFWGRWVAGSLKRNNVFFFFILSVQKPIARHLVVSARPAKPTRPDAAYEAPKREAYPDEVLTHRFRPYGDPGDLPLENHMDVEMIEVGAKEKERPKRKGGETGSSKKKKAKLVAS